MGPDITDSVARYLLGDKNLRRCVEIVASVYPGDEATLQGYRRGLATLLPKYMTRVGRVYGGKEEGQAYIIRANDACVSKMCQVLRSRQPPVPPPASPPRMANQGPPEPDDEIDRLLGYSMLQLYPLDRSLVRASVVSSVIPDGPGHS